MHKNSSTLLNNTTLWYYLGTKHLDSRCENNRTPGVAINRGNTIAKLTFCITLILISYVNLMTIVDLISN